MLTHNLVVKGFYIFLYSQISNVGTGLIVYLSVANQEPICY